MVGTRDLALYAAIVGTLNGLWTLYGGIVRDRARITLAVYAAEVHHGGDDPWPGVGFAIANRGRRPANVAHLARVESPRTGMRQMLVELAQQLPQQLDEGQGVTLRVGGDGHYVKGSIPLTRWFVTDGANRIYPLRERYRQRLESVLFWWRRRRERRRE